MYVISEVTRIVNSKSVYSIEVTSTKAKPCKRLVGMYLGYLNTFR